MIKKNLNVHEINTRIKQEICYETLNKLKDESLMNQYKECSSVKNRIESLCQVLEKHTNSDSIDNIIQDYLPELIPAGTKGVIRGNQFNYIVKDFINNLALDKAQYKICFESRCQGISTNEIPDWYIMDKKSKKIIIGMNQLDLWGGGQQLNRGYSYIEGNKHNNPKSKLLCVVCKEIQFKNDKNKAYTLFKTGFENNTLCYLNNLEHIIKSFFSNSTVG